MAGANDLRQGEIVHETIKQNGEIIFDGDAIMVSDKHQAIEPAVVKKGCCVSRTMISILAEIADILSLPINIAGVLVGIVGVLVSIMGVIITIISIDGGREPMPIYTPAPKSTISVTSPTPDSPYRNFIVHRNDLTIILEDGEQITVEPDEPLILNLGTADGTRVPSGACSCHWDSPAGQIDNSGNCTDVTYQSPGDGTDIVGLTVNGGSVESYQLSLSITVK